MATVDADRSRAPAFRPRLLLHATFVLIGVVTTLLGPTLPLFVTWWALDDGQAGLLFAAQFAGSMLGSVLSSVGMTRVGFRTTLVAGVAVTALGVAVLGSGVHALGVAAIFTYGIGLGLTIPTTNLYVAQALPATRASALSLLNFAWGLGAVGAPALVALFQRTNSVRTFLFAVAGALALMAAVLIRLAEPRRGGSPAAVPQSGATYATGTILFGALLFIYVGTETSVAGWVALYAGRFEGVSTTASVATPSLFWGALLAGRAAAPLVLRRIEEARLLLGSLLLATAGVASLTASRSPLALAISVVASGLGLSTVFPLAFAQFTRDMERAASRAAGSVFVLAGLGGAVLPPLVGGVSAITGSLTAGLTVPLVGCLAMLAVLRAWRLLADRVWRVHSIDTGG